MRDTDRNRFVLPPHRRTAPPWPVRALAAVAAAVCGKPLARLIAWWLNRPYFRARAPVDPRAELLHRRLPVADLHCDFLLWGRDLLQRGRIGHVDLPRLIDGGVALQVFSVVTQVPWGQNIEHNDDASDNIALLSQLQHWPRPAQKSLLERALFQARELARFERASDGALKIVRNRHDLAALRARRARGDTVVGALLSLEGAHALEGDLDNLELLYDAGFRMIAPSHFFDTDIGGSAHGTSKGGLTSLGREWVARMERLHMTIDLAHASAPTMDDVLALATRPVIVSHTGVTGTCDNTRNLDDRQLRGVAATGGVVGIGFWPEATGATDVAAIVRAIRHAVSVIGADHVALGSDFDGAVRTAIDVSQLPEITAALLAAGFIDDDVGKIMGENVFRAFAGLLTE
jgi:microsomal dipeptidase-like Zn-dependent dipeptidase